MTDPKLFKLTNHDKLHYRNLIKNIDPKHRVFIVNILRKKIQKILAKLNYILESNPALSSELVKKILFAMSYVIDEDDEIPDIIPEYGYLDDISVVSWVLNDIQTSLAKIEK
jgi:uncharacterized membrane protein YkvA (DUF1232 family)